ncbi:MAG: hydroxysqualene dehydroxylase HpnE [Alphaproteobacteria bacterium]|nr:hydroxysqualene dehydroxylase HpnE [Alphaproteobacteria bacterium]
MSRAYIVGGGLSGVAAAVALAGQGRAVTLFEAAGQLGGRCRSYFDATLGATIDNGNHLVLSGNQAVSRYLRTIGAHDALAGPERAEFAFVDIKHGDRWKLAPNDGPLPWWIFSDGRRVPGTKASDYTRLAPLLTAGPKQRISDVILCEGVLWERLIRPLLLAALNTAPEEASAALAGAVLRETLAKGGQAYRPRIAQPSLAAAFVEPAQVHLVARGADIRLGARVRALTLGTNEVVALELPEHTVALSPEDVVVLATPPWVTHDLLPNTTTPNEFRSIVNAHFKIAAPPGAPAMLGLINATAEWLFGFADRISVTVSAADAIVERDREALATTLWGDVAKAYGLSGPLPPWQIVKEKRATFAATPEQAARRPKAATAWRNLVLAGDWTDTGLPATIESALRSGETAAHLARSRTPV